MIPIKAVISSNSVTSVCLHSMWFAVTHVFTLLDLNICHSN